MVRSEMGRVAEKDRRECGSVSRASWRIRNVLIMHVPVLVDEVVDYLNLKLGGTYIDATLNGGGHARAILKKIGPNGKVLGIEWDESIADSIKKEKTPNLIVVKDSYTNMSNIAKKNGLMKIDGVLFDFGMSSWHL